MSPRFIVSGSAILVILLVAIAVIWLDGPTAQYFQPRFGDPVHVVAARWTDLGKAEPYFALSALLAFGSWSFGRIYSQNRERMLRLRNWGVQAFAMLLFSGALVQISKHIIGRKRPYAVADLSPQEFHPFTGNYEFHSMPSGHSQVVFSAATILTLAWPKAAVLWYGTAILIAASRVITLNHWVSDTVAGAFVGIVGVLIARRYLERTRFRLGEI